MKNIIAISALLMPSFILTACFPVQSTNTEPPYVETAVDEQRLNSLLIQNSVELASIIGSFAKSPEYPILFFDSPEVLEFVAEIGAEDFASPNKAVIITVPDAAIAAVIAEISPEIDLPNDAYEMFVARMMAGVPGMLNSQEGVNAIVAANILSAGKPLHAHGELTEHTYVVLFYDNVNIVTFFARFSNGMVDATSTLLFLDDEIQNAVTRQEVEDYLEMLGIGGVRVTYIYGDRLATYK